MVLAGVVVTSHEQNIAAAAGWAERKIVALALNLAILIYLVWRRIGAARSLRHRLGGLVGYKAATP